MLRSLSSKQMREADKYTIEKLGVPSAALMERAGRAVYQQIKKVMDYLAVNEVLFVCGGGNNGGDGFVSAQLLLEDGVDVQVLCLAERFSSDAEREKNKYKGEILGRIPRRRYPVIVDCIFGTGLTREVEGKESALIDFINHSSAFVLSVDIPSGINGDNGRVMGKAVKATETITIGELKNGLFLGDGGEYCSSVTRVDIGIDISTVERDCIKIAEDRDIAKLFPQRRRNTHKGSYGKVSILAGSKAYSGAPLLSASAALRGGAGYVELCVANGMFSCYVGRLPEVILTGVAGEERISYSENHLQKLLASQVVAFGMGVGVDLDIYKSIQYLLENFEGKLLLDADALNTLSKYGVGILKNKKCDVLLTPHIKEFSRLSGLPMSEILSNPIECVKEFSKTYGVTVLLKNAVSIVANQNEVYASLRGSACLAKGGSGDVLSGLISSIAAQGSSLMESAVAGSYLMGVAGEICEKELGEYSVTATDVIGNISKSILRITENSYSE